MIVPPFINKIDHMTHKINPEQEILSHTSIPESKKILSDR